MKDIIALQERLNLVEQELKTLTYRVDTLSGRLDESLQEKDDLNTEIKGLMVFLSRVYPDFKSEFPAIVRKLDD